MTHCASNACKSRQWNTGNRLRPRHVKASDIGQVPFQIRQQREA
jgi:hypothetical protein